MIRVPLLQTIALAALFASFGAGCALPQKGTAGIRDVDELVAGVERMHLEAEAGRERAREGLEALGVILRQDFEEDPSKAYGSLQRAIERSEAQARRFAGSVAPMSNRASKVFANWTRDIEAMTSPALRKRSEERRALTEKRYQAVVQASEPVEDALAQFHLSLRDHALFLGNDFTSDAISDLAGEVAALRKQYEALAASVARLGRATAEYVRTSAPLTTVQLSSEPASGR